MAQVLPFLAAGLQFGSQVAGGIAEGNAANYQAQVSRNNATIARQNAGYASGASEAKTEQAALKSRAQGSNLRASLAASGVDVNSGSAADVQESQRDIGALDTSTVASQGAREVYGYETQATGFDAQAKLEKAQADFDPWAGAIKGIGGLVGNPDVDKAFDGSSSLLSGPPSVPADYQWMLDDGG